MLTTGVKTLYRTTRTTAGSAQIKTELTNGREVNSVPECGLSPFHSCYLSLLVEDRTPLLAM